MRLRPASNLRLHSESQFSYNNNKSNSNNNTSLSFSLVLYLRKNCQAHSESLPPAHPQPCHGLCGPPVTFAIVESAHNRSIDPLVIDVQCLCAAAANYHSWVLHCTTWPLSSFLGCDRFLRLSLLLWTLGVQRHHCQGLGRLVLQEASKAVFLTVVWSSGL